MNIGLAFLQNILNGLSYYRYFLTFLGAIVEGPILMVACGMLLKLKFFYFLPIYFSLLLGDFVADSGVMGPLSLLTTLENISA
jgi:hypothetical protein